MKKRIFTAYLSLIALLSQSFLPSAFAAPGTLMTALSTTVFFDTVTTSSNVVGWNVLDGTYVVMDIDWGDGESSSLDRYTTDVIDADGWADLTFSTEHTYSAIGSYDIVTTINEYSLADDSLVTSSIADDYIEISDLGTGTSGPDIIISSVDVDPSLGVVSFVIENQGDEDIDPSTTIIPDHVAEVRAVILDSSSDVYDIVEIDLLESDPDTDYISAGGSSEIPLTTLAAEDLYLVESICVTLYPVISETDNSNNCLENVYLDYTAPSGTSYGDLALSTFSDVEGDRVQIVSSVNGWDSVEESTVEVEINWGDGESSLITDYVYSDSEYVFVEYHTYSEDFEGDISICAVEYDNGTSSEVDSSCETESVSVAINPPAADLIVLSVGITGNEVYYELSNQGEIDLSASDAIDPSEVLYVEGTIYDEDGEVYSTYGEYLTADDDTDYLLSGRSSEFPLETIGDFGDYTVDLCFDVMPLLEESDSSNNCLEGVAIHYGIEDTVRFSVDADATQSGPDVTLTANVGAWEDLGTNRADVWIEWGDGTEDTTVVADDDIYEDGSVYQAIAEHSYVVPGPFDIRVCAFDMYIEEEIMRDEACANIITVDIDEDVFVEFGVDVTESIDASTVELNADVLGWDDLDNNFFVLFMWGDGSSTERVVDYEVGDEALSFTATHVYAETNEYDLRVCAYEENESDDLINAECSDLSVTIAELSEDAGESTTTTTTSGGGGGGGGGSRRPTSSSSSDDVILSSDSLDCSSMPFVDVKEGYRSYEAICELYLMDIIHGRSETIFAPTDAILRGEVAKIIARLYGYVTEDDDNLPALSSTSYPDLSTSNHLAYYIEVMTDAGLFSGYENGNFGANDPMTQGQLEIVLSRFLGKTVSIGGIDTDAMMRMYFCEVILEYYSN